MAKKLLEETKEVQTKKRKRKNSEDDIYKIDFEQIDEQENIDQDPPKKRRGRKKKEQKAFEFDDVSKNAMIANIDLMREKIEESQEPVSVEDKVETEENDEELLNSKEEIQLTEMEEQPVLEKKKRRKRKDKKEIVIEEFNEEEQSDNKKNKKRKAKEEENIGTFAEMLKKETKTKRKKSKKTEEQKDINEGIKLNAQNGMTEVFLDNNQYRIEMQRFEYNIYTENSGSSYIIVRDNDLKIVCDDVYLLLKKQNQDYEIITNQDFKINYVIDNLERKNNIVNFKLTNLTEIVANDGGLTFVIDEEKVIENNLEDNNTLVISEEDGKVYLPYSKEDVKNEVLQNKGTKIADVIEEKYIYPIEKYKNAIRARFREGYNLMYKKEGKSRKSAILLGIELMFETNLHPAIISACKNLEELDIYLDCLEDNELEKFSCFKIIYKSLPILGKKAKYQEI